MQVPDRALIPIIAGVVAAFIAGMVVAGLQLFNAQIPAGAVVGVVVFATGLASVIGAGGTVGERLVVGVLRGLLGAAGFGFLYFAMVEFIGQGKYVGLLGFILAGVFFGILTRLRVRDRGELQGGEQEQPSS